jgi:hypothetical protein
MASLAPSAEWLGDFSALLQKAMGG